MGLNTGPVLALIPQAMPSDLVRLLRVAAEPLGAYDVAVYLVDFQGVVLQPILLDPELSEPVRGEEDVASSMAGRAFVTGQPVTAERDDGVRVWVPLVERGDRTGVVALSVPEVDDDLLSECVQLGLFAGLMVRAFRPDHGPIPSPPPGPADDVGGGYAVGLAAAVERAKLRGAGVGPAGAGV